MGSTYMTADGHLSDMAVVPMGLLHYYLDQHPGVINEVAATILTELPQKELRRLLDEAMQRIYQEGQTLQGLVNQYGARYEYMATLLEEYRFIQHPLFERLVPVTELILGYGCLEHDDLSKQSRAYGLAQGLQNRLRMDKDTLDAQLSWLQQRGVDLNDKALFQRCVAEDKVRYQDIYNDIQIPGFLQDMRCSAHFSDMEVLFLSQIMNNPNLNAEDKQYVLGAYGVSDLGMLAELERQAKERPLLRGLTASERERLVTANMAELEKFVQRAWKFPRHRVIPMREDFEKRNAGEQILSPYRDRGDELQERRGERLFLTSWDLIASERKLDMPRNVVEAVTRLCLTFGAGEVAIQDLSQKTVGEVQFECLIRIMGNRGLRAIMDTDRMGFTSAFYWGSSPEVRDEVDREMKRMSAYDRMGAMERYLDRLAGTQNRPEGLVERLSTVFRRYLRTREVELALPDERVSALLGAGLDAMRRPRVGMRR